MMLLIRHQLFAVAWWLAAVGAREDIRPGTLRSTLSLPSRLTAASPCALLLGLQARYMMCFLRSH